MNMTEYQALAAYFVVTLIVFIGGLLWNKYRKWIKRRFNLEDYRRGSKDTSATTAGGHLS
jgi:hypothetical protein